MMRSDSPQGYKAVRGSMRYDFELRSFKFNKGGKNTTLYITGKRLYVILEGRNSDYLSEFSTDVTLCYFTIEGFFSI